MAVLMLPSRSLQHHREGLRQLICRKGSIPVVRPALSCFSLSFLPSTHLLHLHHVTRRSRVTIAPRTPRLALVLYRRADRLVAWRERSWATPLRLQVLWYWASAADGRHGHPGLMSVGCWDVWASQRRWDVFVVLGVVCCWNVWWCGGIWWL